MAGLHDVGDGHVLLADLIAPVLQQFDDGAAGDAGQHCTGAGGGVDLAVDLEHNVHGADLFHILLLHAVQPQHLGEALLLGHLAGLDGGGVVAAALGEAGQAGRGADVLVLHVDADGIDALGIVGAGGSADDAERVVPAGVDAHAHIGGEYKGTDIQGGAVRMGHPVLVHFHQGLHGLDEVLHRDLGNAHPVGGVLHPLAVTVGAEQLDGVVRGPVGLQALKDLLRVVENHAGGIQGEGLIGDDAGVMPALVRRIVHDEHVVGENLAEAQLALVRGLGLGAGGLGDLNIQHIDRSLKIV